MKSTLLTVALLCFFLIMPTVILAQSLADVGSFLSSPFPTLLRSTERSAEGFDQMPRGLMPPTFNVAYSSFRADAGFEFAGGSPLLSEATHRVRLSGAWLELLERAYITDRLKMAAYAAYMIPSYDRLEEHYALTLGFNVNNAWSTETQLWVAGGVMAYDVWRGCSLVGGLTYNSLDLKVIDSMGTGLPFGFVTPDSYVTVGVYTPYIGISARHVSTESMMNLSVMVCPVFEGTVEYKMAGSLPGMLSCVSGDFDTSYFLSTTLEYSRIFDWGIIGVFGRYAPFHGQLSLEFDSPIAGPLVLNDGSKLSFGGSIWHLGATVTLFFSSPL